MLILRVAHGVRKHFPQRVVEWGLAVILLNWGIILLRIDMAIPPDSPLSAMIQWAPEDVWGGIAVTIGFVRLIALVVNGSFYRTPFIKYAPYGRLVGAFASCFVWLQMSAALIKYDDVSTGLAIYPVFLAWDMFTVFHTARDTIDTGKPGANG